MNYDERAEKFRNLYVTVLPTTDELDAEWDDTTTIEDYVSLAATVESEVR